MASRRKARDRIQGNIRRDHAVSRKIKIKRKRIKRDHAVIREIKIKRERKRETLLIGERIKEIVKEIIKIIEAGKVRSDRNQDRKDLDLERLARGVVT